MLSMEPNRFLSSSKADNWVDRGERCEPVLERVLAFYLDRHDVEYAGRLAQHALSVRGLVEAGGSELHVASYLYGILRELDIPARPRGISPSAFCGATCRCRCPHRSRCRAGSRPG